MQIPKVSRTLVLNLIYLLTITVLAFNISPGYVSTFRQLDRSFSDSHKSIRNANEYFWMSDEDYLMYNIEFKPVLEAISKVQQHSKDFSKYIEELKVLIAAGDLSLGDPNIYYSAEDKKHANQPYNYNDKDITMRILLDEAKRGRELGKKIQETRTAMIGVVTDLLRSANYGMKVEEFENEFGLQISLTIGEDWRSKGAPSWEHYVFNNMPVATTLSILSKIKSDAQNSENLLIFFLSTLMSGGCFDNLGFRILSSPKKSYVYEGEEFETELNICAPKNYLVRGVSLLVNGASLPTKYGIASYATKTIGVGTMEYSVKLPASNYFDGKIINANAVFEYEVGRPSVIVSAEKMNVLYLGVDNPISITAPDVSSGKVKVSASGPVKMTGSGKNYIIKATAVGEAIIKVTGPGIIQDFKFLVKPIPDPLATLNRKDASGEMDENAFKKEYGVFAKLSDFDFDAECTIESFEMHRQPKRAESLSVKNIGGTFSKATQRLQSMAVSGDLYYFDKIMARCPGDAKARKINAMTWRIK